MSFVTEDKTIRGGQRQYGLLDGREDQEVWVPVTDGSLIIRSCHHTALRPFQLWMHLCARPVTSRKSFICTTAITREKNCNGFFKIKDAGRKFNSKREWESHPRLLIMFTQGRQKISRRFRFGKNHRAIERYWTCQNFPKSLCQIKLEVTNTRTHRWNLAIDSDWWTKMHQLPF